MTYNSEYPGYYYKFLELQERLRRSEEERLNLEIKLNEMIQQNKEEEQQYYQRLKSQYKSFVESDKYRMCRNEEILQALERIERKISLLSAKTHRFKLLRQHFQTYLARTNSEDQGKTNSKNFFGIPKEVNLPENSEYCTLFPREEDKKSDSNNHNYVFNYLRRNIQNQRVQETPSTKISQLDSPNLFNEVLPPLYSFSNSFEKNSPTKTYINPSQYQNDNKKFENSQNLNRNRVSREDHDPYTTNHHFDELLNSGLYENVAKDKPDINEKYSSKLSFPNQQNFVSNNSSSYVGDVNIISPGTRDRNYPEKNRQIAPGNCMNETESNQLKKNIQDFNQNTSIGKYESSQKPESNDSRNMVAEESYNKHSPPNNDERNKIETDILTNHISVSSDKDEPEQKLEADQSPQYQSESQFDNNELIQEEVNFDTKSDLTKIQTENHDLNLNDKNSKEQTFTRSDEEFFDGQDITRQEQELMMETINVDPASHYKDETSAKLIAQDESKLLPEKEDGDVYSGTELLLSDSNYANDNEKEDSSNEDFKKLTVEVTSEDLEIKKGEYQDIPAPVQEEIPDATIDNSQQDSEYGYKEMQNPGESENLTETNQNFPLSGHSQDFGESNENYFSNDQYPQYVQGAEPINYDPNIDPVSYHCDDEPSKVQTFDENEQPYVQYDEQNSSFMPYDMNAQGYDQQYYENNTNYENYENDGQQYDQLQYDQYNQENYQTQQETNYDGTEQEQFDTHEQTGAYYSEVEYNQNVPYQEVDTEKLEPNLQETDEIVPMTNLVDILQTDTENISEPENKTSNESDFDFSTNQ